MQLKVCAKTE